MIRFSSVRMAIDLGLCAVAAVPAALSVGVSGLLGRLPAKDGKRAPGPMRRMLVFDTAHSLRSIRASGHDQIVTQRDLGGFFDSVVLIYPMLGAHPLDKDESFGGARRHARFGLRHLFIENKAMAYDILSGLPRLNFLLTQAMMLGFSCRLVRRESISILRGGDPFVTGLYACIVAHLTGRPYSLRIGANYDALAAQGIRDYERIYPSYALQKVVGKFVLSQCDLVLVPNEYYGSYVRKNGGREERTVVVRFGNLIEPVHFSDPRERGELPEDIPCSERPFAIAVARLIEVKYHVDLLRVASEVRERVPDMAMLFVGDGPLRESLEERCREMGLEDTAYFVGMRNQEWLARVYPHATAYVATQAGRALAEAALAGIPMVAYDFDWHSEIVESGETGALVPFRDWRAMAKALVGLVEHPEWVEGQGRRARERALRMMDQARIRTIERKAYEEVLNDR